MAREETPPTVNPPPHATAEGELYEENSQEILELKTQITETSIRKKDEESQPIPGLVPSKTKLKHILVPVRFLLPSSLSCEYSFRYTSTILSMKEYLINNWPHDWPAPIPQDLTLIRFLHYGRFLNDQETLKGTLVFIYSQPWFSFQSFF